MRSISLGVAAALAVAGCTPDIKKSSPPATVQAQFDPAASPAVVPSPNSLALDPTGTHLQIPLPPNASAADQALAAYLDTLDGFPSDTPGLTTFGGGLDATTVSKSTVVVWDIGPTKTPLASGEHPTLGAGPGTPSYAEPPAAASPEIAIAPPATGWTAGHTYAVALIGGTDGLKGKNGELVVGSPTWALVRSAQPLVTCQDLTSAACRPTTDVIPSDIQDPAARLADQTTKAIQLEELRRPLSPLLDEMEAVGVPRSSVALLWTFPVNSLPVLAFQPASQPAQVPQPNDLLKALVPTTAAEMEFVSDYLSLIDGFRANSTATAAVAGPALDPATVNAGTVLVLDITATPTSGGGTVTYDAASNTIVVLPPAGGWTRGHRYAIVVKSGSSGVKDAAGAGAVASDVWALVRSEDSLCQDPAAAVCQPAVTLAPLTATQATQLEALRLSFKPLLDKLAKQGIARSDVAVLWTFSISSAPVVTFDPADGVIPFPNDAVRDPTTGLVKLPIPSGASASQVALINGLNTLDGFSTTVPLVSENSPTLGPIDEGSLDPATFAGIGLLNITAPADATAAPVTTVCLNCASSTASDKTRSGPDQLQIVPSVPLIERTEYGAFVSTLVKDTNGKNVIPDIPFAVVRLKNSLLDANLKSTLSFLSDAQAQALEPLRAGMEPFIDRLAATLGGRSKVALAWAFQTQTTETALKQLHSIPSALPASTRLPTWVLDETDAIKGQMTAAASSNIGKIFIGGLTIPEMQSSTGPFDPSLASHTVDVQFLLVEPTAAAPSGGYPVALFGHGLTRSRNDLLALANTLAAGGFAAIAIDAPLHGNRSTCVGSKAATGATTDDAACADPTNQQCDAASGLCVARDSLTRMPCDPTDAGAFAPDEYCLAHGQGQCVKASSVNTSTWFCQNAAFLPKPGDPFSTPAISGWNFLNVQNFFATRDNFREGVIELAQVALIVQESSGTDGSLNHQLVAAPAGAALDGTNLHFVGQSLSGMVGSLYTSAAPEIHHVVLNVPGGELSQILLTSGELKPLRDAFLAGLAASGLTPGTPQFDQFIGFAQWIVDPADPVNAGPYIANGSGVPVDRKALIQYIEGDQFIPNPTTEALIAATMRPDATNPVDVKAYSTTASPSIDPHGFLLSPPGGDTAVTEAAQGQVVKYLSTGTP